MKTLKSTYLLAFGIFALTFQNAAATPIWKEGYVCSTKYLIQNNVSLGSPVHLSAIIKTAPHCGGSNVFTAYFKHYGGSAKGHNFSRAELLAHLERLHTAAIHGSKVRFYMDAAANSAVYAAEFHGN